MSKEMSDYCTFILSHGRADRVDTYKTLRKAGYRGKIYIVIDNLDKQRADYIERFGDEVIVFDKVAEMNSGKTDTMDMLKKESIVVYARNAIFDIAKNMGYEYFIVLDDDYREFSFVFDDKRRYINKPIKSLDRIFEIIWGFYKSNKNLLTIAFSQGGDFIGGQDSGSADSITMFRKAMNLFFCSMDRRFYFKGSLNEDVNAYIEYGRIGKLFFTLNHLRLGQSPTQSNAGGLTDEYLDLGTYVKSFYTVMISPSSVRIGEMGYINYRLHHSVNWNMTVPKIISKEWKI